MKVSIIAGGKFWAFNLAEALEKNKILSKLVTSYPKYLIKNYKINNKRIKSFLLKEILIRFFDRFPFFNSIFDCDIFVCNYFDSRASKNIDYINTDIIVGWSGFSKLSFEKANKFKCIKVLERGSAHIKFQKEILEEEYLMLGIKPNIPSEKMIKKEIEEYDLADCIIVPSDFAKNTFLKFGISEKKVIKIPYGVDLKEFYKIKDYKSHDDKFRIISTGTLCVRKGIQYLIQAFIELDLINSELVFVGPTNVEMKDYLNKYKKFKNIKFVSKQRQDRLKYFYNKSDLNVQCSIEDGFGMVIPQAMACGLPVICTENTGGSEIIDDGVDGYVIPIRNINILKNKIKELYSDRKKLNQMSFKAHEKSIKKLSWEKYGETVVETYKNLIKKKFK
jgi:glycosyltransferase involved in cell wall biosynthesis